MRIINLQLATTITIVAFASVLNACGKSQQDVATKPLVENTLQLGATKEVITLKGVSFDKPNMKEAVNKLCEVPDGWGEFWCKFSKYSDSFLLSMPQFKFGNLSGSADVWVTGDGALIVFSMYGTSAEMITLADLLSEKYGKPLVKNDQIANRFGTKFNQKTFVWIDSQGTQMTVKSIDRKIDEGSIFILSASNLASRAEAELKQKNEEKSNL